MSLRRVEDELNALTSRGAKLHRNAPGATFHPGIAVDPDRLRFQRRVLDEFLAEGEEDIEKDGLAAFVLTTPPRDGESDPCAQPGSCQPRMAPHRRGRHQAKAPGSRSA